MRIVRNRVARTVTLDQELYVTKALEKYGLAECKVAETPEVVGAASQEPSEEQQRPTDHQRYMEIVGTLMYAAISTRPDIAHAVHYLASNMLAPTHLHMVAAERVLRYLAGTKAIGLVFGSRNGAAAMGDSRGHGERQQLDVCAFADADWANNRNDRKSITGWVAKLNGDPISWSSKKQRTVALSTCEAELYAEAAAIQEVLWLRGLMKELRLQSEHRLDRPWRQSIGDRGQQEWRQERSDEARRHQVSFRDGVGGARGGAAQVAPDKRTAGGYLHQGPGGTGVPAVQKAADDAVRRCWRFGKGRVG